MLRRFCTPLLALAFAAPVCAQGFDSGSDGSDGALTFPAGAGVIEFDPQALGIDLDGDNTFNFTSVDLPAGTVVRLRAGKLGGQGRAVVWLVQGTVTITGTLDLSGDQGSQFSNPATAAEPGAGGFAGGVAETIGTEPGGGAGPGGGGAGPTINGGQAGHLADGGGTSVPGVAYGNRFLLPLLGGSGGSGGGGGRRGTRVTGGGGGAGGGAILIVSSTSIDVSGLIDVRGGAAGFAGTGIAGGGSAGAIRLVAPLLTGGGTLNSTGGSTASPGRVRLEAFQNDLLTSATLTPQNGVTSSSPGPIFLPADAPRVQVTAVDGVAVAASPTASFVTPDVVIDSDVAVTITIAAQNVPVGTQVTLRMISEDGASITVLSDPLAGTQASSTASAGPITVPSGFSRFFVTATFPPQ